MGHDIEDHHHHHHDVQLDNEFWAASAAQTELEGEVLIDFVTSTAQRVRNLHPGPVRRVADIGSGPGVAACALAEWFPDATVIAIDGSSAMLERAEAVPNNDRIKHRNLLLAMCYENAGDQERAEAKYKTAQGGYVGEEAKARYALFLKATGRIAEAKKLFRRILDEINSAPWAYRREQRAWREMAKANLVESPKP